MNISLVDDIWLVSPIIVLSLGALLILMAEVFLKNWPKGGTTIGILLLALVSLQVSASDIAPDRTVFFGAIFADPMGVFFSFLLIAGTIVAVLLGLGGKLEREGVSSPGEYYSLLLMSTAGAIVFANSAELITLFIGLETMSMALYCLCGSALGSKRGSESALKYFVLGSFSSAFLLYGVALVYGLTGSTQIPEIAALLPEADGVLLYVAIGLVLIGLAFKIAVVPFHFWAPDVYEGAPTQVTAYMAVVVKAAAIAATVRIMWGAFGDFITVWAGAVWFLAFMTIAFGNLIALRQRGLKRMLAYSSIAHAGYLMMAFLAPAEVYGAGPALLYYLVAYLLMTMGAFAVVIAVTGRYSSEEKGDDIRRFYGLSQSAPFMAAGMTLFMFSLAGLPPGMAGLFGKFYLFSAVVKAEYIGLVIIGVIGSAVSCYYYLRVVVAMYFMSPDGDTEYSDTENLPIKAVILAAALGIIAFGLFPSWLYDSAAAIMNQPFWNGATFP